MNKRIAIVLLMFAALILSVGGPPRALETARAQGVFFGAQRFSTINVDANDNLYLMMSVATAAAGEGRPHSQIFFTMSRDFGVTWDNMPHTRNLSKSPGEAFGPSLAVNRTGKARLYVTYHDNSNGTNQAYLISSKKKTKFRAPLNITPHDQAAFAPRVALDSNETVNIVWGETEIASGRVVFVRSTDLGLSFNEPIDVSRSAGVAFDP